MVRSKSVVNRLPEPGVKVFMTTFAQHHRQPGNVILPASVMFVLLSATSAKYASRKTRRDHDGLASVRYKPSNGDSCFGQRFENSLDLISVCWETNTPNRLITRKLVHLGEVASPGGV